MQKFLLLVRTDIEKLRRQSDEKRYAEWPDMADWVNALVESGNYITGQPLTVHGRSFSRNNVLSDGPFIESKEGVIGFDVIVAEDIEQAVKIAQRCPMVERGLAIREVRPMASPQSSVLNIKKLKLD